MNSIAKALFLVLLLIVSAFFVSEYMATVSFSGTPVNIAFGDTPETNPEGYIGKYYVGTALMDGDSSKYVFVPEGMTYQEAMALQFTARSSVWKADILNPTSDVMYSEVDYTYGIGGQVEKPVPFKTVDMVNARITLGADVKLGMPDGSTQTGSIGNIGDYTQQFIVKDSNGIDRTIYIRYNELSFKSGVLPPAGDLDVITTPDGYFRLITHDNLVDGTGPTRWAKYPFWDPCTTIKDWNCYFYEKHWLGKNSYVDDYEDYFNWMVSNNKIPDKKPSAAERYDVLTNRLFITYPSTVFTQSVTFYIPEELAEFIMISEPTPEFRFDGIANIDTNEGDLTRIDVKGTAINSGTINLHVEGAGIESYTWTGGSEKQIVKGKSYTFQLYVRSPQVNTKSELPITVFSQPSGMGVATQTTFYNTIEDTTALPHYDLTIKCIDSNENVVDNARIYVNNDLVGYGSTTKSVVKGNHYVHAENVTGWYSGYPPDSPKFVSVDKDMILEIPFTTEPKPPEDYTTILIIGGITIVVIILLSMIAREFDIDVTVNHVIILIILVVVVVMGYIVFGIALDIIDRFITAIENFKLIG